LIMKLKEGARFLAEGGLNLLAVFDCADLPSPAAQIMAGHGVPAATVVPVAEYRRLVVVGHGGRRMWEALQEFGMETDDPVDDYSIALTRRFIQEYLDGASHLWLYPGTEYIVPLQQLGEAAGWSYPSPLGLGISPVFGVWFAYRTAFLIDADLPLVFEEATPSPCDSCAAKPCIQSCPVGAVQVRMRVSFDVEGCARHRLRRGSPCADRCLARMACPYFPEHRYTLPQMRYHYGRSLETLRAWFGDGEG
jgi:epoxyqueuosine reductase